MEKDQKRKESEKKLYLDLMGKGIKDQRIATLVSIYILCYYFMFLFIYFLYLLKYFIIWYVFGSIACWTTKKLETGDRLPQKTS